MWGEVVFNSDICAEAPKPQIPRSQLLLTCEQCGTRLGAAEHPGEGACSRSPGKAFLVQYRKNCVPNKGGSDESMRMAGTEMETELLLGFVTLGGDMEEDLRKHLVLSVGYLWQG